MIELESVGDFYRDLSNPQFDARIRRGIVIDPYLDKSLIGSFYMRFVSLSQLPVPVIQCVNIESMFSAVCFPGKPALLV